MTQVSKRPLSKDVQERIFDLFTTSISNIHGTTDVYSFINDLLSPTEQLMLAKRIAISFMLQKGFDQRTVSKTLKVSVTTVNKVNSVLQISGKGYRRVIQAIVGKDKQREFWNQIEVFLSEFVKPKGEVWKFPPKR